MCLSSVFIVLETILQGETLRVGFSFLSIFISSRERCEPSHGMSHERVLDGLVSISSWIVVFCLVPIRSVSFPPTDLVVLWEKANNDMKSEETKCLEKALASG